jgi:hypothetical protein
MQVRTPGSLGLSCWYLVIIIIRKILKGKVKLRIISLAIQLEIL